MFHVSTLTIESRDNQNLATITYMTILVMDLNEEPWSQNFSFYVQTNANNGTEVGAVTGIDPDNGQTLTYTFVDGNIDNAFFINPITGVITVNNGAKMRSSGIAQYNMSVKMTDDGIPAMYYICYVKVELVQFLSPMQTIADNSEILINTRFKVYPNPSSDGRFNVKFEQEQTNSTSMYLYDLNGRLVWEASGLTGNHFKVDAGSLIKGSYILKSKNGYINFQTKVLIQ